MDIYNLDFAGILTQLENLEKMVNNELRACEDTAKGYLSGYCRNHRMNFFQTEKVEGRRICHGITGNQTCIQQLCRKAFLEKLLQMVRENQNQLIETKKHMNRLDFEEIICSLPQVYQTVPKKFFMFAGMRTPVEQITLEKKRLAVEIRAWEQAIYEKSMYRPEERTNITSRGERVRSKGEVVIAEKLYQFDVPFRYEEVLYIGKYIFAPDFKPRRRRDGKVFYWEHCGMPYDERYMRRHKWKLQQYESIGIVPWDNLIVTYNDADGNIDMRIVESEIRIKLL